MADISVPRDIIFYHGAFVHHITPEGPLQPQSQSRNSASLRKLAGFSERHLIELSSDMYDESQRRLQPEMRAQGPLPPRDDIHWKRNDARRHVGSLPEHRFKEICRDLVTEHERRHPELKTGPTYPSQDAMPMAVRPRTQSHSSSEGSISTTNSYSLASKPSNESANTSEPAKKPEKPTLTINPSSQIQSVSESSVTPTTAQIIESESESESDYEDTTAERTLDHYEFTSTARRPSSGPASPSGSEVSDNSASNNNVPESVSDESEESGESDESDELDELDELDESDEPEDLKPETQNDTKPKHSENRDIAEAQLNSPPSSVENTRSESHRAPQQSIQKNEYLISPPHSASKSVAMETKAPAPSHIPSPTHGRTAKPDADIGADELYDESNDSDYSDAEVFDNHEKVRGLQSKIVHLNGNHSEKVAFPSDQDISMPEEKADDRITKSTSDEADMKLEHMEDEIMELRQTSHIQMQVTEQVRKEAGQFLKEMRELTKQHEQQVSRADISDSEANLWKQRHAKLAAELEHARKSRLELAIAQPAVPQPSPDHYKSPYGKVDSNDLNEFLSAISVLVVAVHDKSHSTDLLDVLHRVITSSRKITTEDRLVSRCANQLISVVRNYTVSTGLFPRVMVDSASSDLTTAVVEYVKGVKVLAEEGGASPHPAEIASPPSPNTYLKSRSVSPFSAVSPPTQASKARPKLNISMPIRGTSIETAMSESPNNASDHSEYAKPSEHIEQEERRPGYKNVTFGGAEQIKPINTLSAAMEAAASDSHAMSPIHSAVQSQTASQIRSAKPIEITGLSNSSNSNSNSNSSSSSSSNLSRASKPVTVAEQPRAVKSHSNLSRTYEPVAIMEKPRAVKSHSNLEMAAKPKQLTVNTNDTKDNDIPREIKTSTPSEVRTPTKVDSDTTLRDSSKTYEAEFNDHQKASSHTQTPTRMVPSTSSRFRPKQVPEVPVDESALALQNYSEDQTTYTVDAISALLAAIKSNSVAGEIKPLIVSIQTLVGEMIDVSAQSMTETRSAVLKDKGTFIVQNMRDCLTRMDMIRVDELEAIRDDARPNRHLKQRLAGVNFDMAKCTKELVKSVEEVVLESEAADIDRRLH